ncbi:MAG: hypothetical protein JRF63_13220 [Deltaproteobacteria bacterium]|nr:hypothetical protein [Deltaproteobacteria bacterium]
MAIMQGSSSRRMLSPYWLQRSVAEGESQDSDVPRQILIGEFDGSDYEVADVVVIADEAIAFGDTDVDGGVGDGQIAALVKKSRVWMIPGTGQDGQLDATRAKSSDLPDFEDFQTQCSVWASGDLDPSGSGDRDEVIGIDNGASCFGRGSSPAPRLLLARVVLVENEPTVQTVISDIPGDARVVRQVMLRDLDGDGDLDLLALFAGETRAALDEGNLAEDSDEPYEGAAVVVIWNEDGDLAVSDPTEITFTNRIELFDVAPIHLDADTVPELAILTGSGGYIAQRQPLSGAYELTEKLIPDVGKGRLEVGDFNNDGLDDLAVTDYPQIYVKLAKAAGPIGATMTESSTEGSEDHDGGTR